MQYTLKEILVKHSLDRSRKFPERLDSRWKSNMVFPKLHPKFLFSDQDKTAFTIGSCFARNIEVELRKIGISVPILEVPKTEYRGTANNLFNEYSPGTIAQRIQWSMDKTMPPAGTMCETPEGWVDLLLHMDSSAVSYERCVERREQLLTFYEHILKASFIVITLGHAETWFDLQNDCYINRAPLVMRRQADRFLLRQLSLQDMLDLLSPELEKLTNLGKKIILTVSPQPLHATFMLDTDAVVANELGKSTLLCAARELAKMPDVDYFPSYEIVRSGGIENYGLDGVHTKPEVTRRVVEYMIDTYFK